MDGLRATFAAFGTALLLAGCAGTSATTSTQSTDPAIIVEMKDNAAQKEKEKKFSEAAQIYAQMYSVNENDMNSMLGLARNMRRMGQTKKAKSILTDAESRFGKEPDFLVEMAKVELAEKNTEQASLLADSALSINPDHWPAHSVKGIAMDMKGDYAVAAGHYEKALNLSKGDEAVLNNYALSRAQAGDLPKAISLLETAVKEGRGSAQVRQNLALLYGIKGEYAQAKAVGEIDLDSKSVENNMSFYKRFDSGKGKQPRKIRVN